MNRESSVNRVELSGYVTNCILRRTSSGKDVANFILRIIHFDKVGTEHSQYVNAVAWKGQAVRVAALPKDAKVRISGRLSTAAWVDKPSGQKKYRLEITCSEVEAVSNLQSPLTRKAMEPVADEMPF